MRSIISLGMAIFLSFGAAAQEHEHAHDVAAHLETLKAYVEANSTHGPVVPQPATVDAAAAKTFNMTARSFTFSTNPSPFVVDQGDVVTINLTVPSNDAGSHGIIMSTYIEDPVSVSQGQTKQIVFTATTPGNFQFICSNSGCGTGHFDMQGFFTVRAVAQQPPHVTSVAPLTGPPAGGTAVTITGSDFVSGATVKFGGVNATNVQVGTSTTITATAPAHALGAVDVVVTNPDGQTGTLASGFTYVNPGPTVSTLSPNSGPTSGNTFVTIAGTNFQSGATVTIGGVAATNVTVVNATTITAMTPLGPASEQLGAKDVVVTNPDSSKGTLAAAFTYSRPPLAVTLVTPSAALPAGGAKIAISGAGFTTALATTITIGGVAATNVQVVDAVTMTATAPPHAVGPVDVVVNVGGTSVTIKGAFAYLAALPRHRPAKH